MFKILLIFVFIIRLSQAQELADELHNNLPNVFELDDYYDCLSQKDGLYCVGTFELALEGDDKTTKLLKELSRNPYIYNRTLLRRGYCVSRRCPSLEPNSTLRFIQCAAEDDDTREFGPKLKILNYCRTYYDSITTPDRNAAEQAFLYVIGALLLCNIVGTVYDLYCKDGKKNKMLVSWSVVLNWKRLTISHKDKDPRLTDLAPLQGARVVATVVLLLSHVNITYVMLYLKNEHTVDQYFHGVYGALLANGTSLVQIFVMLSSFLCSYNLLLSSEKKPLSLRMLPKNIIKRIIRISPVHLLLVGYAATWWVHARDGPMWHMKVGSQMEVCKRKFWSHALFINNFVEPENYCFIQTWFMAVDMQLYIVAIILTILLSRCHTKSITILTALYIGSCILISGLSYHFDWKSMLYITYPEALSSIYIGVESFLSVYITPLGNLPASLMGVLIAHLHYMKNKKGSKLSNYKWLVYTHNLFIPVYFGWSAFGYFIRPITWPWFTAMFIGFEKAVVSILCAVQLVGLMNVRSFLRTFFASRVWNPLARLSLSVVMIHWCINVTITAGRHTTIFSTIFDVVSDGASTLLFSYALAVPVSVMVEIPVQRFLDAVLF